MAARKTLKFLPTVFQTDVNSKFLSATLDQLVSEPNLKTVHGYIGRKFAPTFKARDSYVVEDSADRQNYQLEPSLLIRDEQKNITFFASYLDLLNKIEYYGGLVNNHDRLFTSEYYSFDPHISFDKFVNFTQYFWLPNGPDPVDVSTGTVELSKTITVTRNASINQYEFSSGGTVNNTLILARGGSYKFIVDQPGSGFWIQTELGIDGRLNAAPNLSSREVLGVENNGAEVGEIVFNVPPSDAQDRFTGMRLIYNIDYAAPVPYTNLHNNLLSVFTDRYPAFAGITGNLNGKTLIFVDPQNYAALGKEAWTAKGVYDANGFQIEGYDDGTVVPENLRYGVWRVQFVDSGVDNDPIVKLVPVTRTVNGCTGTAGSRTLNTTETFNNPAIHIGAGVAGPGIAEGAQVESITSDNIITLTLAHTANVNGPVVFSDIGVDNKVYVRYGINNANKEYYKDYDGFWKQVPLLSSTQRTLYIQDATDPSMYTQLSIVEAANWSIDIEQDILGQKYYTSPNGVEFTSGLKVRFGTDVTPAGYQNKTYYAENIGDSIRLVDIDLLITPEPYNDELAVNYPDQTFPDYITINRCSIDLNAWSRNNRWFHRQVIEATARYNNTVPQFDQTQRAQRPIIQFEKDMQLINSGRIGKQHIDILDVDTNNAFNDYEGLRFAPDVNGVITATAFGVTLTDGLRVLFANDDDPLVRDKIYVLSLVRTQVDELGRPTGDAQIKLTVADDGVAQVYDTLVVAQGRFKGSQWWFDGVQWLESQQKTTVNQDPLFDVFSDNDVSISEQTGSNFTGTRIFGYRRPATGTNDPVLGFPLSYRNFGTQGDIEFVNYYDSETYQYTVDGVAVTQPVATGFIHKITDRDTVYPINTWRTVVESSRQYQLITFVYEDSNSFVIDVAPAQESTIPYLKVYVNSKILNSSEYSFDAATLTITINSTLAVNDKVDILVYSKQVSSLGHYRVPLNLDLNAQNIDLSTLTLGQLRNHVIDISTNTKDLVGNILGPNNLRDIEVKQQGGDILQHSAPVTHAMLALLSDETNFISALRYAQQEYARFKNKFLEYSISLQGIDPTDPVSSVDLILTEINKLKNKDFSWYYSDMVPYGPLKTVINDVGYTIFDPLIRTYEISNVFSSTTLSNQAVLVYLNGLQLVIGRDYVFNTDRPAVTILDTVDLNTSDLLTIVEYQNTDGNYIPETPTKLGLYPKFVPEKFVDDTYRQEINVIRGHDGSLTPAFDDYRDQFLIELERRIYNNIKLSNNTTFAEIYSVLPGKFRNSDYTIDEMNQILGRGFLSWVGNNQLEFNLNNSFESSDAFTWNYSSFNDKLDSESLPGSWRACYNYFYDTDAPHLRPWEMLGFSVKPSWWEDYYGPAPYTGGNSFLWDDLEAGRVVAGERAGIDLNYARPGLSQVIPVDDNGNLKSPVQIMTASFSSRDTGKSWAVGEWGPVETAWRRSSDYPFAVQQALALAVPGKYFGLNLDVSRYSYNTRIGQYLTDTNDHIKQSDAQFNGDISTGTVVRAAGYLNWIADYLTNLGINPATRIPQLRSNYTVNLAYKMAGFSDKKYLQVLAEQSSPTSTNDSIIIPNENYEVYLHKSTPVNKLVYSAVIVARTDNGFSVRGYNLSNPYFTIIPSIPNTNAQRVDILNLSATFYRDYQPYKITVPYGYEFSTSQQVVDFLISYERFLQATGFTFEDRDETLRDTRNFKLSSKEFLYWVQQGWPVGSIIVLSPIGDTLNAITIGAITDGISDSQFGTKVLDQNFKLVKNNNYIVYRTPESTKVKLSNNQVIGYLELDLVQYEHVLIFDNTTVFNDIIYKPELGNRQYRLKLIGQKTGDWDGSLYAPGFIYNSGKVDLWVAGRDYLKGELVQYKDQFYVALDNVVASDTFNFTSWKTADYNQIKKGLLPNLSSNAVRAQSYYDSYGYFNDADNVKYSHGLIGFKPRAYLDDLGLNETTQVEFYKGYITQKGSANAVDALTKAEFNNLNSAIEYYEEWAVRVGEYGAVTVNPYVEIKLDEKAFAVNPARAEFITNAAASDGVTVFSAEELYRSTDRYNGLIASNRNDSSNYDNDIPTAGYVNLDDVDATIFDLADYKELDSIINQVGSGYTIWVAKDFQRRWNVYRVTETDIQVVEVDNLLDGYIKFRTDVPHGVEENSVVLIRNFGAAFDGFYQVFDVVSLTEFTVAYSGNTEDLTTLTGDGILFRLDSLRFLYMEDARKYVPPHGWKAGEKIWIDLDAPTSFVQGQPYETGNNLWKVYEKQFPYGLKQRLEKTTLETTANIGYGKSVKMFDDSENSIVVGSDMYANLSVSNNTGLIDIFDRNNDGEWINTLKITPDGANTYNFGYHLDTAVHNDPAVDGFVKTIAVGAPKSTGTSGAANVGLIYIYNQHVGSDDWRRGQIVVGNVSATGDHFGFSFAFDEFGHWLYVGAPGNDHCYVYALDRYITRASGNVTVSSGTTVTVPFTPKVTNDADSLLVTSATRTYIPNIDYTLSGTTLTFSTAFTTSTALTITQQPYYRLLTTIESADVGCPPGSEFGYAIDASLDGAQLGVGAPNATVNVGIFSDGITSVKKSIPIGVDTADITFEGNIFPRTDYTEFTGAGAVYVIDRIIEAFNSTDHTTYTTVEPIPDVTRVTVDNVELSPTEYTTTPGTKSIILNVPLGIGKVVNIETNKFTLLEKLIGIDSLEGGLDAIQFNTRFGTAFTICSNNCAFYVGAPYYDNGTVYNTGAVWKFHHKGRLYGINTGFKKDPTFTPGDTIRLDNFEVRVGLALDGHIIVNKGDYITQPSTGANVRVTGVNSTGAAHDTGNVSVINSAEYITTVSFNPDINNVQVGWYVTGNNIVTGTKVTDITVNNDTITITTDTEVDKPFYTGDTYYFSINPEGSYINISAYANTANVFTIGSGNISVNGVNAGVVPRVTTLDEFVSTVNDANLLGISAVNLNGFLRLTTDKTVAKNLLRTLTGTNTDGNVNGNNVYADAEMAVFAFMQIIINPYGNPGEYFGTKVILARNAYMLLIASERGTTRRYTTFDGDITFFDSRTTGIFDSIKGSGSVYTYELYDDPRDQVEHPGRYAFCQQIDPGDLNPGDRYGAAIDIIGGFLVVTATKDDTSGTDTGSVYVFNNQTGGRGWNLIRYQQPTVDIDSVNRIYLYNNQTNTILTNLEYIDPAKGKILGQAEQEITYKTAYDPAVYNRGSDSVETIQRDVFWGPAQVGKVWWDLDKVRFVDYEQDSLTYRTLNWGRLFPGSVVEVCEWVESDVLPSQYAERYPNQGVPKYANDTAYVEVVNVDNVTNIIGSKYYFWVVDKPSLDENLPNRQLPLTVIRTLIENPKGNGTAYAAVIADNSVIVYNVSDYLSADNTILHIDYELLRNDSIIHSEYELIQRDNNDSRVPTRIVNKLIDSLSGKDAAGNTVPDANLSVADRYGIEIRPRQSMFVDRVAALSVVVEFVNTLFAQYPISAQFELNYFTAEEPTPNIKLDEYNQAVDTEDLLQFIDTYNLYDKDGNFLNDPTGYRVLVNTNTGVEGRWTLHELAADRTWNLIRTQSYKTSLFWDYVDWYYAGYDSTVKATYAAETLVDALKLPYAPGDIIKINNTGAGTWELVLVNDAREFFTIGRQNGTVQLNATKLSNTEDIPSEEIRNIINGLLYDIFTGELDGQFNSLFFALVNYIFSEQSYVDWIFKTSFISVVHQLRGLIQPPNYIKDNQTYYESYIEEVKPYSVKIREYLINYDGSDVFDGSVTDFDLPAYYDTNAKLFRSPSGEIGYVEKDEQRWQTEPYNQWYQNRKHSIESITVENPGSGYTEVPVVEIYGDGSGAAARAIIDGDTGAVTEIEMINSGSGYTLTPIVIINGNGVGATAYARLKNQQVRSISTTMKFDRVGYVSNVQDWSANTVYTETVFDNNGYVIGGDVITYQGVGYTIRSNMVSGTKFVASDYDLYLAANIKTANDRIMSYYQPTTRMTPRDLKQLISGIEYPGVNVVGLGYEQSPGFSGPLRANVTLSSAVANVAVGDYIAQPLPYDLILSFDGTVTVTAGSYITQPYANGANATVYANVVNGYQVLAISNNGIPFVANTAANVLLDEQYTIQVNGSNVAYLTGNVSAVDVDNTVGANIRVTKVWSNIKVSGVAVNSEDFTLSSGNIKINGTWVSSYPTAYELVSSTEFSPYDSTIFDPVAYDDAGNPIMSDSSYDAVISSTYTDANLGLRPEDINIAGGAYVDRYSSHAPEELIPGVMYETLNMQVYTKINGNVDVLGYRIFNRSYYFFDKIVNETSYLRIADRYTTNLAQDLLLADTEIHVVDSSRLAEPSIDNQIPGVIFIGGERIIYWINDLSTNTLRQIRRGTQGTGTPDVHSAGTLVYDASLLQEVPGTVSSNVTISANTVYDATDTPPYQLRLSSEIVANVGDIITQATSGANATVVGRSRTTDLVWINYNNANEFDFSNVVVTMSANIAANVGDYITQTTSNANVLVMASTSGDPNVFVTYTTIDLLDTAGNIYINGTDANIRPLTSGVDPVLTSNLAINGTYTGNVYPLINRFIGYDIDTTGNTTIGSGNILVTANVWSNVSANVSAGIYERDTVSEQILFLKAEPATYTVGIITENAVNILTTEDGDIIIEE